MIALFLTIAFYTCKAVKINKPRRQPPLCRRIHYTQQTAALISQNRCWLALSIGVKTHLLLCGFFVAAKAGL
jgi:hypothetical protein